MEERKILVAKSYENLPIIGDIFIENGKQYINVRTKTGTLKKVRAYSEKEYSKFYPEVKIIQPAKSQREIFGFGEAGYIWLFKGNTYENLEWFRREETRYARFFGWYLPSDIEMPSPIPVGVEPFKLYWEQISADERKMLPENEIKAIVDGLIYEPGISEWAGEIGDKVDIIATCTRAHLSESIYGVSTFHTFEDEKGNIYTWSTTAKSLNEGSKYHIKGNIKDLTIYRNAKQTVLTRCRVEEI